MTETASDIKKRLKTIVDYVRDCEARVVRGEIREMQGLDKNVEEICNEIATLPRSESREMEQHMAQLVEGLDQLATAMRRQQENEAAMATSGEG